MKICPRCESEFEDWVADCPDCEVALRSALEMPTLSEADDAVFFKGGSLASLRPLSATLRAAGIPTRIAVESAELNIALSVNGFPVVFDGWTYCLFVAPPDLARAEVIESRWIYGEQGLRPADELPAGCCPSCGEPLAEAAEQCPACGLIFPAEAGLTS